MTVRIGIDFGAANTVVARWNENSGRGEPVPLDGIDLIREAGEGVTQRVVPSLIAYTDGGDQRWVGAQVAGRPELIDQPRGGGVPVDEGQRDRPRGGHRTNGR